MAEATPTTSAAVLRFPTKRKRAYPQGTNLTAWPENVVPMVEAMGLDWSAQLKRVKRDPILTEGMAMMATPFGRGGDQEAACIRMDLVNGWLFTIDSTRIKDEEVRQRVLTYQRECYAVLHRHFTGKSEAANDTVDPDKADKTLSFPERIRAVTEARQSFDTIAAREMWFKMGLPIVPSMLRPQPYQGVLFSYEAIRHPDREAEDKAA